METPPKERKTVEWEVLNEWRLQAMKAKTVDSAIKVVIFNMMLKEHGYSDPALPQKVIDFLKPTILLQ